MQAVSDAARKQGYLRRLAGRDAAYRFLENCPVSLLCYGPGEDICVSGGPMPYFLLLVEGKAEIFISTENGKALLLEFVEDFQVIGDLELACSRPTASASVRAVTQAYCLAAPMAQREALLGDQSFLRLICAELAQKLDNCSQSYAANMLYPLESRLASYLLHTQEGDLFCRNLGPVSEYLGASYRHMLRVLKAFCGQGLLRREAGGYRILNGDALRRLAGNVYQYEIRRE